MHEGRRRSRTGASTGGSGSSRAAGAPPAYGHVALEAAGRAAVDAAHAAAWPRAAPTRARRARGRSTAATYYAGYLLDPDGLRVEVASTAAEAVGRVPRPSSATPRSYRHMPVRVGINGFGRIGRNVFRAAKAAGADIECVAVNDLTDKPRSRTCSSTTRCSGRYPGTVEVTRRASPSTATEIKVLAERDPANCLGRPRRRRRHRVDRLLHRAATSAKHLDGRRQEGHHLRPGQGRGHHGRPGRQLRQVRQDAPQSSPTRRARRTASRRSPRRSTTASASSTA